MAKRKSNMTLDIKKYRKKMKSNVDTDDPKTKVTQRRTELLTYNLCVHFSDKLKYIIKNNCSDKGNKKIR